MTHFLMFLLESRVRSTRFPTMLRSTTSFYLLCWYLLLSFGTAFCPPLAQCPRVVPPLQATVGGDKGRRRLLTTTIGWFFMSSPQPSLAASDPIQRCKTECIKSCQALAPNDTSGYCQESCTEYCNNPEDAQAGSN